jgi:hypothetical protein
MLGVPVEAFLDSADTYAGDRFAISYVPSATIHTWLQETWTHRSRPKGLKALLVGDPECVTDSGALQRGLRGKLAGLPRLSKA